MSIRSRWLRLIPRTLRWQLAVFTSTCMVIAILADGLYIAKVQTSLIHDKVRAQMTVVAQNLAAVSPIFLIAKDFAGLESSAYKFATPVELRSLLVTDENGKPIVGLRNKDGRWNPDGDTKPVPLPVGRGVVFPNENMLWYPIDDGRVLGWVRISYQSPTFLQVAYSHLGRSLVVVGLTCVMFVSLLLFLLRSPMRAFDAVTEFAAHLDERKGARITPYKNNLELEVLANALNTVSIKLKSQQLDLERRQFALDQHAIVSITDLAGTITYVNDLFCVISQYSSAELLGQNHRILNSGHHPAEMFDELWQTICEGKVWHGEILNRNKYGSLYWTVTTIVPVLGKDGLPEQYISIRTDTTERKKNEDAANSANRAKSDFLANMSHEIRTPMNGVIGMIDILQETPLLPEQKRILMTIQQSSLALLQILNDILDLSKIEACKLNIENIPTYLPDLVESTMLLILALSKTSSVKLCLFIAPELASWFECDPTRVRQVLLNLLGNAVKFSVIDAKHYPQVTLRVTPCMFSDGKSGVRFTVLDNGIGMSDTVVSKLFQPFMQADESTARQFGGTGLGLSITYRLVELMNGRISVRSALGKGSEFIVELPLMRCEPGRKLTSKPSLSGIFLIVVTDDAFDIEVLRSYGQFEGAQVEIVADIAAAGSLLMQSPDQMENTVLLIGLSIETPTKELNLPHKVGVVRMVLRENECFDSDLKLFTRPLLKDDFMVAIAQAGGRLNKAFPEIKIERRTRVRTVSMSIEEAVLAKRLILLADDNETNRDVIEEQLRMLGHTCEIAADGEIALQMWKKNPTRYALLLTDCHMPNLDGFALTEAIRRAEPKGTHLPVIAVTANAMNGITQRCHERGMDDYLSKPLRMNELRRILDKWLPLNDKQLIKERKEAGLLTESNSEPNSQPSFEISLDRIEELDQSQQIPLYLNLKEYEFSTFPIWSADTLRDLLGDKPPLHRRMLEKFLLNAEKQVSEILAASTSGDTKKLYEVAHTLKSAANSVGALALGDLCQQIETAGVADDNAQCLSLMGDLVDAHNAASAAIHHYLIADNQR